MTSHPRGWDLHAPHGMEDDEPGDGYACAGAGQSLPPGTCHPPCCSHCRSTRVQRRELAGRASALLGLLAGGLGGSVKAIETMRQYAPDIDSAQMRWIALLSAALLGALAGATTGCGIGAALGERIDTHVWPRYRCLQCGGTFTA